jgi:hypothetical protein
VSKTKWPIGTEEESSKYLGVTIGKRLEWQAHVQPNKADVARPQWYAMCGLPLASEEGAADNAVSPFACG